MSTWHGSSSSQASQSLHAQPLLNFSWCPSFLPSFLPCDMFSNLPVLTLKTFFAYSPSTSIPSYNVFYLYTFQGVFIFQFSHSFISFSLFWLLLLILAAGSLLIYLRPYPHVSSTHSHGHIYGIWFCVNQLLYFEVQGSTFCRGDKQQTSQETANQILLMG